MPGDEDKNEIVVECNCDGDEDKWGSIARAVFWIVLGTMVVAMMHYDYTCVCQDCSCRPAYGSIEERR